MPTLETQLKEPRILLAELPVTAVVPNVVPNNEAIRETCFAEKQSHSGSAK